MPTLQIRLGEKDEANYERLKNYLTEKLPPGVTLNASGILRSALAIAVSGPLCPYCDTPLREETTDDGGTLGVWVCPDCSQD